MSDAPFRHGEARPRCTEKRASGSVFAGQQERSFLPTKTALNQAQSRARFRRQRHVECLHRLGPAPLGHFLREIELGANVAERLESYARLDPDFIRVLGGDQYASVVHVIEGGRL
jgi:hypothetical protein